MPLGILNAKFFGQVVEGICVLLHILVPTLAELCPPGVLVIIIFHKEIFLLKGIHETPPIGFFRVVELGASLLVLKFVNNIYPTNV